MRLVGTGIVAHAGRDSTGRWLDDAFPNLRQTDAHAGIVECAEHGVPVFRAARLPIKDDIRLSQQVHLPLAADGRTVDMVLSLRSEEHTSELQSLMRISYAVFCLKKKKKNIKIDKIN